MVVVAAMVVTALSAALTFYRIVRGPTLADRIVAGSVIATMLFGLIVMIALYLDEPVVLDVALVYAVLQFLDLLIFAKYMGAGGGAESAGEVGHAGGAGGANLGSRAQARGGSGRGSGTGSREARDRAGRSMS